MMQMNFKDVMIALGQLPYEDLGFECSGIVTKVGSKVEGFTLGDIVCGVTRCAFASVVRTTQSLVSRIPRDMNIDAAASFPLVFCTALYSLTDVARLQKGESILIHCAAGGVGQASVMLAQHLGAELFVTISSLEKRDLVMSLYGIPKDHVFSSRDTTFEVGIRRLTKGAGVDVVLNCLSGEALHASWRCLADFGRFVEIGKRDLVQNNRLEMNGFINSMTFSAVDLGLLVEKKPWVIGKLMADIVEMFNCNNIKIVSPLNFYSMSEIQDAMRLMQAGKHMGKVVIRTEEDDMVRVRAYHPESIKVNLLTRKIGNRSASPQSNCEPRLLVPDHWRHWRARPIDHSLAAKTRRQECHLSFTQWEDKSCSAGARR